MKEKIRFKVFQNLFKFKLMIKKKKKSRSKNIRCLIDNRNLQVF